MSNSFRTCVYSTSISYDPFQKMSIPTSSAIATHTGLIEEYVAVPLVVKIWEPTNENKDGHGFVLKVQSHENSPHGVMTVSCNIVKGSYSTTSAKAKEHVLNCLEIARLSIYSPTHLVRIQTPMYPCLSFKATELDKVIEVTKKVMDTYM